MKNSKNVRIRTYGPIGLGLAAVPALPYLLISQWKRPLNGFFHKGFEVVGGKEYVGDSPSVGREQALEQKHQKANRNKEL